MIYIMAYSRKSSIYLFLCFNICFSHAITTSSCTGPAHPRATCLIISWSVQHSYSANTTAEPLQSCTNVATVELPQLEFRRDFGVLVSPLQAAPDQFKFWVSLITSVLGPVQVGALPVVLSESRYMTSVRHSESVVVRLSGFDQMPTRSN